MVFVGEHVPLEQRVGGDRREGRVPPRPLQDAAGARAADHNDNNKAHPRKGRGCVSPNGNKNNRSWAGGPRPLAATAMHSFLLAGGWVVHCPTAHSTAAAGSSSATRRISGVSQHVSKEMPVDGSR